MNEKLTRSRGDRGEKLIHRFRRFAQIFSDLRPQDSSLPLLRAPAPPREPLNSIMKRNPVFLYTKKLVR